MSEQTGKTMKPPYLAYETFKNALRDLGKAGNLPDRIDNSVFPQMSGSGRAQFIQSLKFFKLIDENGKPDGVLWDSVPSYEHDPKSPGSCSHCITKTTFGP